MNRERVLEYILNAVHCNDAGALDGHLDALAKRAPLHTLLGQSLIECAHTNNAPMFAQLWKRMNVGALEKGQLWAEMNDPYLSNVWVEAAIWGNTDVLKLLIPHAQHGH